MIGLAAVAHSWMVGLSGLSQLATGSLVAAVWQGILLAAVAGLGLRLLPKTPAAVRFAIWFGVFLVVTALPVLSLLPHAAGAAHAGGRGAWLILNETWCLAIAAVWAAASLVRAGTLVAAALRVRALWKRARPVEMEYFANPAFGDEAAMNRAPGLSAAGRAAQVCTSDEVDRPTVIGFFSPKILIPAWLLEKLTAAELEQIVLHEAGHLGRADDWMNLLQKIALVVFPLNPALAWVERRLCFERELAVDERVLQAFAGRAGAAKAYAACLATLAEYRLGRRALALALGALGHESQLGRRVGRILQRSEGMKPLHVKLVLGGAMLGLVVAATGFERCPQVVGFSNGGPRDMAHGIQWQPTHGDETAMNGAPGLNGAPRLNGRNYRAVGVVYKTSVTRMIQPITQVSHDAPVMAADSSRQSADGDGSEKVQSTGDRGADGSARMVQTTAPVSSGRNRSRILSDAAPSDPADVVMQWVVVTSWQDGQGTRMVFTTTRTTSAAGQAAASNPGPAMGEPAGASEQRPRYEAVPVRGGWLVIEL